MQKITVKEVKGPLGKGERKFYAVVDEKGAEFTTFDGKVADLAPGSVIAGEITVTQKGEKTYVNLGEWKLLEAGPLPPENGHKGGQDRGPYKRDTEGIRFEYELKAYIESVKHVSIEAQTAFNGIVKLVEVATISDKIDALVAEFQPDLWQKALAWAESRLDQSMVRKAIPEAPQKPQKGPEKNGARVTTGNGDPVDPEHPFANVGQLLQWALKEHTLDKATVMEICGVNEQTLSKLNLVDAHIAIVDYIKLFGGGGSIPE